ncbi:hypothetical protein F5Y15DRAFT_413523 [Xylariaceae sp. FL0016]|nr:hypothetical protein F5Y15DRAFT_413523 [Xylariaceae sp. FL0016]
MGASMRFALEGNLAVLALAQPASQRASPPPCPLNPPARDLQFQFPAAAVAAAAVTVAAVAQSGTDLWSARQVRAVSDIELQQYITPALVHLLVIWMDPESKEEEEAVLLLRIVHAIPKLSLRASFKPVQRPLPG